MTDKPQPDAAMNGSDDGLHVPGLDHRWRESFYFSFFDFDQRIGGFTSIGRRPEKGHIGSINVIWGETVNTLAASELGHSSNHREPYEVAGLSYRSSDPFGAWTLQFAGTLNDGGDGKVCSDEALKASAESVAPSVPVSYELTFRPGSPAHHYKSRPEWRDLFSGHTDETGTMSGRITVGSTSYQISGRAAKDHSWGVRDWYCAREWRWAELLTREGGELVTWRATFDGTNWIDDGAIFESGRTLPLRFYQEEVDHAERPRKPLPSHWRVTASAEKDSIAATGEVVRITPVVFGRRRDNVVQTSWNDRALIRCVTDDGVEGWANVEFQQCLEEPDDSVSA